MRRRSENTARGDRHEGEATVDDGQSAAERAAAAALRPGVQISASRRRHTISLAMREFHRGGRQSTPRDDAGSRDSLDNPGTSITEVPLHDGGRLVVSDIEPVTPDRLEETARAIAESMAQHAKKDDAR